MQKKSYHCCIKFHENGKNTGFFCNDLTSKLHKIKTTEAISKIKKFTGLLGFPLQFLFPVHCYKTNGLPITAADLYTVRGGETKLPHGETKLEYGTSILFLACITLTSGFFFNIFR